MPFQMDPINFNKLLSHTFPGFFSAITLFMLIDLFSSIDLAKKVTGIEGFLAFLGFILLAGTFLGIIIDSIHHELVSPLFKNEWEIKYIRECLQEATPKCKRTIPTLFNIAQYHGEKAEEVNAYLNEGYYYYSEFFANIFISLTFFSVVIPFYLFKILLIPWIVSVIIAGGIAFLGIFCLHYSCRQYKSYLKAVASVICPKKPNRCEIENKSRSTSHEGLEVPICLGSFIILVFCVSLIIYDPTYVISNSDKMEFNLSLKNKFQESLDTVTISNMGADLKGAGISFKGLDRNIWVNLSSDNKLVPLNKCSNSFVLGDIMRGEKKFIEVKINISNIAIAGSYKGNIIFIDKNCSHILKEIDIDIQISPT